MLRDIQDQISQKQRWILLLASGTTWFVLWLLSAAVFKRTERDQNWSYFQALYFTFISLMTIGYGDFYPTSNAGKSLFVFWSLLAVPIITILVSSMGDTIVKKLKDYSIWLGEIMLHVGEFNRNESLNYILGKTTRRNAFNKEHRVEPPQHSMAKGERSTDGNKGKMPDESIKPSAKTDKGALFYSHEDIMNTGLGSEKDQHYYHYLLIKAISNVIVHIHTSPLREYTYDEWARFLALISRGEHHRVSPVDVAAKSSWVRSGEIDQPQRDREDDELGSSDRLGNGGYLRSDKSEAQWMLEHLIATLERELRSQVEGHL